MKSPLKVLQSLGETRFGAAEPARAANDFALLDAYSRSVVNVVEEVGPVVVHVGVTGAPQTGPERR